MKILYDGFFKEVFSPEYHVERLEEFLSLLLGKKIKIKQILPNDSVRLADEQTLLITDIVIESEDGTIANLEIQKNRVCISRTENGLLFCRFIASAV